MKTASISLGEKIRQVRMSKGYSQENLAHATGKSKALISRLERGESEFDSKTLAATRKFLDIEKAPLIEYELNVYKSRMLTWNDLVSARRLDEAKAIEEGMAHILKLPYERDLNIMYRMIASRALLSVTGCDPSEAKEHLNAVEDMLEDASDDALYLYNRVMGALVAALSGESEELLKYSLKAYHSNSEMRKSDMRLVFGIGVAYYQLKMPIRAALFFERVLNEYRGDHTTDVLYQVVTLLGHCHMFFGDYERAYSLFEQSLVIVKGFNNSLFTSIVLTNIAAACVELKDYEKGIEYCDEALLYIQDYENEHYATTYRECHVSALTYKAKCLQGLKNYVGCKEALELARQVVTKDDEGLIIQIETQHHITTLGDANSLDYLENVALPYAINAGLPNLLTVLELCDILETQHRKRGAARKADVIVNICRDVYREMIFGVKSK